MAKRRKEPAMNLEIVGSSAEPTVGDIFGYRVNGSPFYFGRVIKTGLEMMGFDMALIYLYKNHSASLKAPMHLTKEGEL